MLFQKDAKLSIGFVVGNFNVSKTIQSRIYESQSSRYNVDFKELIH